MPYAMIAFAFTLPLVTSTSGRDLLRLMIHVVVDQRNPELSWNKQAEIHDINT